MYREDYLFHSQSEDDTRRFGAALAQALPVGANVALIGTLGAGKTRLVQAVASALGVPRDEVTSPTFVLVNQYRGSQPVIHIDAYRLRDDDEFLELGPEEFFESDALVLVEWADRFPTIIPDERLEIQIESTGEQTRAFSIAATGERYLSTVDRLRELLRPV